ncbi:MAG: HAD-IC family P-type ATPase [Myxococcales bacterium]|nr:HAD-IC family P-type ATPase [Myxococcales bacterium]
MTTAEVLEDLGVDPKSGLAPEEAERRLERDGPNKMTARGGKSTLRRLLDQFVQPLIVILIVAAFVSFALGDVVDAIVIGAVVLVNALIGFFQEHRAEQAIAALDAMVVTEASVIRGGQTRRVRSEALVVGDVVVLQAGDAVPADVRLLRSRDLQTDEAALTGESVPVMKSTDAVDAEAGVGDRSNMAFAGTAVTFGAGTGVVVATGDRAETGRIASMIATATEIATPLTRRIASLSKVLVWIILGVAGGLFAVESVRGAALSDTFNAAVALAVGAIPEGLPAAVTVLLAVGVSHMARRRALIRRLPAVETLGSTTVICSDKTGTLTENQMTVTRLWTPSGDYVLEGVGYAPEGAIRRVGEGDGRANGEGEPPGERVEDVEREPVLALALRCGALCNDTRVLREGDEVKVEGDPTEAALLVAAEKAGLSELVDAHPRLDEIPFASQHMYMASLHGDGDETPLLFVKGSSEALLKRCVRAESDAAFDRDAIEAKVEALGAEGLRVLCLAYRRLAQPEGALSRDAVKDLVFLGLVGMIDPPRAAARSAVAACQGAGIQVKMITGDHAVTASAIAAQIGLEGARAEDGSLRAITGVELAELARGTEGGEAPTDAPTSEEALERVAEVAEDVAVFARVAPEQKLLLVRALQKRGHVVAMTGDGVNDAPALEQADIGVAMGKGGTDVARGASAMILTDDDFATIAAAVEEGRGVYDNLVKFITWTLPTNGGEGLVLLAAVLTGAALPILPVQILWVNMATAVLLGIALVFEPKEPGLMDRPPRDVNEPILSLGLGLRTLLVSVLIAGSAFGLFEYVLHEEPEALEKARTVAVNTIVVIEVAYLFACRSLRLPLWKLGLFTNPYVWLGALVMLVAQLLFTYVPVMNRLFHSAPLEWFWWLYLTAAGAAVFVVVELKKLVGRRA